MSSEPKISRKVDGRLIYEYAAFSHVGRVRLNNEDSVAVDPKNGLMVLADGMGGYNAGEVASEMAVQLIINTLPAMLQNLTEPISEESVRRTLQSCVQQANTKILETARNNVNCAGMGTTLVVSLLLDQKLLVGHIGDSRAYLWREGCLQQLSRDHSLVQEQLDAGLIGPEEAANSLKRNWITRALGVDLCAELDVQVVDVCPTDVYLLCSDGLSDMVCDDGIASVLVLSEHLSDAGQSLIEIANAAGGHDNVSVALMRAKEPETDSRSIRKV